MINSAKKLELHQDAIHRGELILINKHHPIKEKTGKCMIPADSKNNRVLLEIHAAMVFRKILNIYKDEIIAVSGFRSKKEQENLYAQSVLENGLDFTSKYVALPDCSEHQTGLAIDVGLFSDEVDFICPEFPYTGICQDFRKQAANMGFIQRYPNGKENITGIGHEPWHFRYVGWPHSCIIQECNLVLEEYLNLLKNYPYSEKSFNYIKNGRVLEISYLAASLKEKTTVFIPADKEYHISGNNKDGFIITLWRKN